MTEPEYAYVWEYEVRPARTTEFLRAYGPNGSWVALFRGSPGYVRTELHRDRKAPRRYLTIDYWESMEAWEQFRNEKAREFEDLDALCESYTLSEREIGRFEPAEAPAG